MQNTVVQKHIIVQSIHEFEPYPWGCWPAAKFIAALPPTIPVYIKVIGVATCTIIKTTYSQGNNSKLHNLTP